MSLYSFLNFYHWRYVKPNWDRAIREGHSSHTRADPEGLYHTLFNPSWNLPKIPKCTKGRALTRLAILKNSRKTISNKFWTDDKGAGADMVGGRGPSTIPPHPSKSGAYNFKRILPDWGPCGTKSDESKVQLKDKTLKIDHKLNVASLLNQKLNTKNTFFLAPGVFHTQYTDVTTRTR